VLLMSAPIDPVRAGSHAHADGREHVRLAPIKDGERPIIFVGGKGGVGKTTCATALAGALARAGERTLLVSTDPAHSTGDLLAARLGDEPLEVAPLLWAVEIDAEAVAERYIAQVREDLFAFVDPAVRPAIDRHLALARSGAGTLESALLDRLADLIALQPSVYDRIVIDTAPTGHMLRLLAMPEVLERWIQGLVRQREGVQGMDRMLANMVGESPEREQPDRVLDRLRHQRERLTLLRHRLVNEALLHAVLIAERLPIEETVRTLPALRSAGMQVGSVIVNRLLPPEADGEFLLARRRQQDAYLEEIRTRLSGEHLVLVHQQPEDVSTPEALALVQWQLAPLLPLAAREQ
jgi:arsenite-transporting ATPase